MSATGPQLQSLTASELAAGVATLASLPTICMRLDEAVNDPLSSNRDVARVIGEDPGLTARLLQLANSSFYGFPSSIDTITRAVTVIGPHQLRDLALATTVVDMFDGIDASLISMEAFWRHSVSCAVAARILATCRREHNVEQYFIAGLLHDVGRLVMVSQMPSVYRELVDESRHKGELMYRLERRVLGFDHADVGAALLARWRLPPSLIGTVAHHHQPAAADDVVKTAAAVVHVSDVITHALEIGGSQGHLVPPLDDRSWQQLRIPEHNLPWILKQLEGQYEDAMVMIFGKAA